MYVYVLCIMDLFADWISSKLCTAPISTVHPLSLFSRYGSSTVDERSWHVMRSKNGWDRNCTILFTLHELESIFHRVDSPHPVSLLSFPWFSSPCLPPSKMTSPSPTSLSTAPLRFHLLASTIQLSFPPKCRPVAARNLPIRWRFRSSCAFAAHSPPPSAASQVTLIQTRISMYA